MSLEANVVPVKRTLEETVGFDRVACTPLFSGLLKHHTGCTEGTLDDDRCQDDPK